MPLIPYEIDPKLKETSFCFPRMLGEPRVARCLGFRVFGFWRSGGFGLLGFLVFKGFTFGCRVLVFGTASGTAATLKMQSLGCICKEYVARLVCGGFLEVG